MARLDRMEDEARSWPQLAATLGREFSYELLAAAAGADEPTLQAELAALVRAEILYPKGQFAPLHLHLQACAPWKTPCIALRRGPAREFHRRIAVVLEERFPQTTFIQPELLAHHWTEAGRTEQAACVGRDDKVFLQDLGSTNGTFLNDEEVKGDVPLRSGDLVKVGGAIFKFLYGGNVESLFHEEIYRITIGNSLTQCFNKRYFLEFLEREMARGQRYGRPLSLMMFDLDHFKQVNDTHGHLAGDHVLRELAQSVRGKVRKEECLARYGGEEFALVSPESGPARVRKFAEKLRQIVETHQFLFDDKKIPVTISVGVAGHDPEDGPEPSQFIKVADTNLYLAKKQGRNRVVG